MKYLFIFIFCFFGLLSGYSQAPFFLQKEEDISVLYRDCVNDLWLSPQNACEALPFKLTVSDATFWQDSIDKRHVKIVPRGIKAKIEIYYYDKQGKLVYEEQTLKVIDPPGISYHFEVEGKWTSGHNEIDRQSKITFTPLADTEFRRLMPEESDYRVDSMEIYVLPPEFKPPQFIAKIGFDIHKPQQAIDIHLPEACFAYGSGTQVHIQIGELYRTSGQGELVHEYFRCTLYERLMVFTIK